MGELEIVRMLIQKGALLNTVDGTKRSAMSFAAERGHTAVVKLLLAAGADPSLLDEDSKSALD